MSEEEEAGAEPACEAVAEVLGAGGGGGVGKRMAGGEGW